MGDRTVEPVDESMNKYPGPKVEMTSEKAFRQIGKMFCHLGNVVCGSIGNAEEDYARWLKMCRESDLVGTDAQLRLWFIQVLEAGGIGKQDK